MGSKIILTGIIPDLYSGDRLDLALSKMFPEHSRERIKSWIQKGECLIDGSILRPKDKVRGGEKISINATASATTNWEAQDLKLELDVVYIDTDIIVINKPANLVVHPGNSNSSGTLVNILLHKFPDLESIPRGGIVHRLDKDTTGLMVVARTLTAHNNLVDQLRDRTVSRIYEAVVWGVRPSGGTINVPIGRNPKDRTKMAVIDNSQSRDAKTHYRIIEKFRNHMWLKVILYTGRTHQIRVHMTHINHPLVGDKTYGRKRVLAKTTEDIQNLLQNFPRQALHAKELSLIHPTTNTRVQWEAAIPADMEELINTLRNEHKE